MKIRELLTPAAIEGIRAGKSPHDGIALTTVITEALKDREVIDALVEGILLRRSKMSQTTIEQLDMVEVGIAYALLEQAISTSIESRSELGNN